MKTVRIVLPPRDEDFISESLRAIVKRICETHPEIGAGYYGLGGMHGYTNNFENDVFVTRAFDENYICDCPADAKQDEWLAAHPEPRDDAVWDAFEEFEAGEGAHAATCATVLPNFRHKATGFEVRWHKWIGRSMEMTNEPADVAAVIEDCLRSLP